MNPTGLSWELIGKVSRSFALSLRLLPPAVQPPITLAYLLARITDTEADGPAHEADRILLQKKSDLLDILSNSPDADLIQDVWSTIQEGQHFDRTRFPSTSPLTEAELDRYTYLVAGSVGVFWTRLCCRRVTAFSRLPISDLETLGIQYGKALQLVNILRDRKKDASIGRIYLAPDLVDSAFASARSGLAAASSYIASLQPGRLRAATALPASIAGETLDLLGKSPTSSHPKIPRTRVYILLAQTLLRHGLSWSQNSKP
ncbi:MAG: phytoene/squalene synthase family protein [Terrimicrobiaceae bacterium]